MQQCVCVYKYIHVFARVHWWLGVMGGIPCSALAEGGGGGQVPGCHVVTRTEATSFIGHSHSICLVCFYVQPVFVDRNTAKPFSLHCFMIQKACIKTYLTQVGKKDVTTNTSPRVKQTN